MAGDLSRKQPPSSKYSELYDGYGIQGTEELVFFLAGVTWIISYFGENLLNLFYVLELWILRHN